MHGGGRYIGVGVDAHHGFDGVDGGQAVRASAPGGFRGRAHPVHVGGQLGQHGDGAAALGGGGEPLHQLRHLADVRAQAALGHVGAGEIELHRVRPGLLAHAGQLRPFFLVLAHDGGQDELMGIVGLELAEDGHVFGRGVVGQLLDVLKPGDAAVVPQDGGKTGRSLVNVHVADGLEARAGPPGLKGPGAHVVGAGHHGGGQQEGVFQRDAAQVAGQAVFVLGHRGLALRQHLVVQTVHHIPDGDLARPHAGPLAGGAAGQAGVFLGQALGGGLFGAEPKAAQQAGGIQLRARAVTGGVGAKSAADHIRPADSWFKRYHPVVLPFHLVCFFIISVDQWDGK